MYKAVMFFVLLCSIFTIPASANNDQQTVQINQPDRITRFSPAPKKYYKRSVVRRSYRTPNNTTVIVQVNNNANASSASNTYNNGNNHRNNSHRSNRDNIALITGVNLMSSQKTVVNNHNIGTKDTHDTSFFVGAEATLSHSQSTDIGLGMRYEFNKDDSNLPIYVFAKMNLNQSLSLTGSLGYNFYSMQNQPNNVKINNGLYYAVGLEAAINPQVKVFTEYNVRDTNFSIKNCHDTDSVDITSSKLALGLKFNI